MLFNLYPFLFGFLPVVLIGYQIAGHFRRKAVTVWLTLASLTFYAYWRPAYLVVLLASIFFNYLMASLIGRTIRNRIPTTWLLGFALALDLGTLCYYKYPFRCWTSSGVTPRSSAVCDRPRSRARYRRGTGPRRRPGAVRLASGPVHAAAAACECASERQRARSGRKVPSARLPGGCLPRSNPGMQQHCARGRQDLRRARPRTGANAAPDAFKQDEYFAHVQPTSVTAASKLLADAIGQLVK